MQFDLKYNILENIKKLDDKHKAHKTDEELLKERIIHYFDESLKMCEKEYTNYYGDIIYYTELNCHDIKIIEKCIEELGFKIMDSNLFSFVMMLKDAEICNETFIKIKKHNEKIAKLQNSRRKELEKDCNSVKVMLENGEYEYEIWKSGLGRHLISVKFQYDVISEFERKVIEDYFNKFGFQFMQLDSKHWGFVLTE